MKIVKLRLSYNGKKENIRTINLSYGTVRFATGISVKIEDWDEDNENVRKTDRQARIKNARLLEILHDVEDALGARVVSDDTFKAICKKVLRGEVTSPKTLLDYFDEFQKTKLKPGTLKVYTNARAKVEEFDKDITLDTINRGWLVRFEAWLKERGYKSGYISIIMRSVRAVINYCIDCEYTNNYPFRRFHIHEEPTIKRCLTVEQLRTLRDYPVEEHQVKYRDAFMLSFYLIGINFADLFGLTPSDYSNGRITYARAKTATPYDIKVEPEAAAIIEAYKGKAHLLSWADEWKSQNFLERCNRELKKIGTYERAPGHGGKKVYHPEFPGLSTYWARHTWATIASQCDIPVDIIGRALGHVDEAHRVTNIYIRYDIGKIDDANRKVLDRLKEKPE